MLGRFTGSILLVRIGLWLAALALVVACSEDDKDREASDYPGVTHWDCYANTATGICDCYGLGLNENIAVGGSDIEDVDDCSGYAECKTFFDEEEEEWLCGCGPTGFTPGILSDVSSSLVQKGVVPACPPDA